MPVLGSVEPFDGSDQFESYLERVELYFVANSIGECPADAANHVVEADAKKKLAIFYARHESSISSATHPP